MLKKSLFQLSLLLTSIQPILSRTAFIFAAKKSTNARVFAETSLVGIMADITSGSNAQSGSTGPVSPAPHRW